MGLQQAKAVKKAGANAANLFIPIIPSHNRDDALPDQKSSGTKHGKKIIHDMTRPLGHEIHFVFDFEIVF